MTYFRSVSRPSNLLVFSPSRAVYIQLLLSYIRDLRLPPQRGHMASIQKCGMSPLNAVRSDLIPQNRLFLEAATTNLKGKHPKSILTDPLMTFAPRERTL